MKGSEWKTVSNHAKDLITKLLEVNEKKRIGVLDAAKHPFFDILKNKVESTHDL